MNLLRRLLNLFKSAPQNRYEEQNIAVKRYTQQADGFLELTAVLPPDPPAIKVIEKRCVRILPNGQYRYFNADRVVADEGPADPKGYGEDVLNEPEGSL